jgi:hypothetical protein
MIRFYLDSNVFRYVKEGHPSFDPQLSETMNALKGKILYLFSDAHLDDLQESPAAFRDIDLKIIGDYCGDNYFMWDPIERKVVFEAITPMEAFYHKDYQASKAMLQDPFNIDQLFKDLGTEPEVQLIKDALQAFWDSPASIPTNEADVAKMTPNQKEWYDKIMPGFKSNMTVGEMMKSISPFSGKLLNDSREVHALRRFIATYMDRSQFSYDKWGLEFDERFRKVSGGKSFLEMIDSMILEDKKNDTEMRFNYAFTYLEMFNITQERTGKRKKKAKRFDFQSLYRDAHHAYIGSYCDYFITDDTGLHQKAHVIYQLMDIKTKVLTSKEFANMKSIILANEDSYATFNAALINDLGAASTVSQEQDIQSGAIFTTYATAHPYFNYFNRLQVVTSEKAWIGRFFVDRTRPEGSLMKRELELVLRKILAILGTDDENLGELKPDEKLKSNNEIRTWKLGEITFILAGYLEENSRATLCLEFAAPVPTPS